MTHNQKRLLNFCWSFYRQNDQLPTAKNIADHFGWASPNAAVEQLFSLYAHGMIERNLNGKWKFTEAARLLLKDGPLLFGLTVRRNFPHVPANSA